MEYYLISEQEEIQNRISANDLKPLFQSGFVTKLKNGDVETEAILLPKTKKYIFTDIVLFMGKNVVMNPIYTEFFMISDLLKPVFLLYEPEMLCKPCALIDEAQQNVNLYWLCKPPIMEFKHKMDLQEVCLDEKKLEKKKIFMIQTKVRGYLMVSLEVVESILRRNCQGIQFQSGREVLYYE